MERAILFRLMSISTTRTSTCLPDFYHLPGIFDESVSELTDMDETVLFYADICKGPKASDIGDYGR